MLPEWRGLVPLLERNIAAHGDSATWRAALAALPDIAAAEIDIGETIRIGTADDCDESSRLALHHNLMALHPWRKGPFDVFGTHIDTEWRSDWKWKRVAPHVTALEGRLVLDVGCGNGYYGWRMCKAGARAVIGIDPTIVYTMQYLAIAKYLCAAYPQHSLLPARLEDIPTNASFDTAFSMGVLYHRREPIEHLRTLHAHLRSDGELVLETLIVRDGSALIPEGHYAQMRNVWHVPDRDTLGSWIASAGFRSARIVDVNTTSVAEQRTTPWMRFASLAQALDPNDATRTIEGHPAPVRCVVIAKK
jgi:tRNA (mo5U34)-methyltransferase